MKYLNRSRSPVTPPDRRADLFPEQRQRRTGRTPRGTETLDPGPGVAGRVLERCPFVAGRTPTSRVGVGGGGVHTNPGQVHPHGGDGEPPPFWRLGRRSNKGTRESTRFLSVGEWAGGDTAGVLRENSNPADHKGLGRTSGPGLLV
ncbi:unnamed protein product [Arctogadus glacialis]